MKEQSNCNNYKQFVCEYRFDGKTWDIDIYARSWEEAKKKLKCVSSGEVLGIVEEEFPANITWLGFAWIQLKGFLSALRAGN